MGASLTSDIDKTASSAHISTALASRPVYPMDSTAEKNALQALAETMVSAPREVLPQFVKLAMKLAGGISAGLSLYEPEPVPGVFRWRHLQGLLAPFEGATTPRTDSPCEATLDRNAPTLCTHPERIYSWISDHDLIVPEVLLVPLSIGGDEPLGTLWIVADRQGHFHQGHADSATELAAFAGKALRMVREEERLRTVLDEQELIAREMGHRLMNLFAMADGMIWGSARNAENVNDLAAALSGRLHALADAHSLVHRSRQSANADRVADLQNLVGTIMKVHEQAGTGNNRIVTDGPSVPCGDHAINALALAIHELATNAAKYGALAAPEGRVKIEWRHEGNDLLLSWKETGGASTGAAPSRSGFGTRLISMAVEKQLGGSIAHDWEPGGLAVSMRIPVGGLLR